MAIYSANPKKREVKHCSGCGRDHVILFYSLLVPVNGFTEEGTCEISGRTIYARVEKE